MPNTFFDKLERWGNKLPHPVFLFLWLSLIIIVTSFFTSNAQVSYTLPGGNIEHVNNLLSLEAVRTWLGGSVKEFISFPPLGVVIIATIGIGLADSSGLISYSVQRLVSKTGKWQLTVSIMILGILSNVVGSVGYIVLIPLACRAYQAANRPPLAGLATAFAGVAGGTHATVFLTTYDVVIAGITTSAAQLIDPTIIVSPLANYFFMSASVFALVLVGSFVSINIVEKRQSRFACHYATPEQRFTDSYDFDNNKAANNDKAMWAAAVVFVMVAVFVVLSTVLPNGWLAPYEGQPLGRSEVMRGLPIIIAVTFGLSGLAYGYLSGSFKCERDLLNACQKSMSQLGVFLLIIFVASQMIYLFKLSQLSGVLAMSMSSLVTEVQLHPAIILLLVVILCAFLNIFMGSPIVQWSMIAPVLIPSLFYVGIPLEVTQAAFRIGDSVTNIISPLFGYLGLILAAAQDYDKEAKLGTLMSLMLPFSLAFLLVWTTLLLVWVYVLQWPMGL
ncbi:MULTISPECIES: AbgT family transporter [Vibrio]|uniref:AbgT family transporter n=1 Tax=Vibrio TaxID=662 RepID=UPI000C816596|nr:MULTISPECIES: AbgT family transporter [Vibrio]MCC4890732.1 AbgT family transporter [Vibrio sp. F13]MDH5895412.1 AbgT family transporter [Vibrio splendidus]TCN99941.1 aminobenzoyl-glutamate transport protein [Vibrio crassostreae]CAK3147498.1 aminobenzoyl-glutamate transport protein [Vibrio crassostreae]CAK3720582.1 aminobenzoyl-glutamate transport protein [Vibrio crassostreae]